MNWPWKRKSIEDLTIGSMKECLESSRPDLQVSLWLQDAIEKDWCNTNDEVRIAFLADCFLREVNSGGIEGVFRWQFEQLTQMITSLYAVGAPESARIIEEAIELLPDGKWPQDRHELDRILSELEEDEARSGQLEVLSSMAISASLQVELATHSYIKEHLGKFMQPM